MFPLYRIGFYNAIKTIRYKGIRTRHIKFIDVPFPLFIIRLFKNIECYNFSFQFLIFNFQFSISILDFQFLEFFFVFKNF